MLNAIVKVKYISADADATLPKGTLVLGVVANTTTLTSAASVAIGDVATSAAVATGNHMIYAEANTADATNYEGVFGVMLPYPIKAYTSVSVDVTNCVCYIYYI